MDFWETLREDLMAINEEGLLKVIEMVVDEFKYRERLGLFKMVR